MRGPHDTLQFLMGDTTRTHAIRRIFEAHEAGEEVWLREVFRGAGTRSMSSVQREVKALQYVRLVRRKGKGGALFLELQEDHPLFEPLRDLVAASRECDEWEWVPRWRRSARP